MNEFVFILYKRKKRPELQKKCGAPKKRFELAKATVLPALRLECGKPELGCSGPVGGNLNREG